MQKSFFPRHDHLNIHDIKGLRISLASPEHLRSWSSGEITKAETINYRTLKPEPDGLFCERIFGPTRNWTCACGKYKRVKDKGKVCEKCGVLIAPARLRRMRMGHIELAAPVCHVWYSRGMPGKLALLLDLPQRALDRIIAYTHYIVCTIDEAARLAEIQRVKAEIERLKADPSASVVATPSPPIHTLRSYGERIPILAGVQQGQEEDHDNDVSAIALVEPPSPPDVGTILGDLKAFATLQTGGIITAEARTPSILDDLKTFANFSRSQMVNDVSSVELEVKDNDGPTDEELAHELEMEEWEERLSAQERLAELCRVKHILSELAPMALLEIEEYRLLKSECAHVFEAGIGPEVIETLLASLDLERIAVLLRGELEIRDGLARSKVVKRLKIVESLRRSHVNPTWMILRIIPVLPPDLRPVLALDGGRFAASDINELYSHIIHRNNRLKHFLSIGAPDIMIFREKQSLQQACDALFDNGHLSRPALGSHKQPLRSLSDSLSGKNGRFRHNLLGKRVDYSGRSVISVGLDLKMHQCGLPKKIALELFKPFLIQKLLAYNYFTTPRQAKRAIERHDLVVWDVLDEVMHARVVLLNRAPTLHRLSIQAFEPVLVEGHAIRLHPQVCSAFNADFDGDQMAVHLPLSTEAQKEARELMLSTRNMLSPASGEPSISVAQEQVLGCYYLTQERPAQKGEGRIFADINDAMQAYAYGVIDLQAHITVRIGPQQVYEQPPPAEPIMVASGGRIQTTVGRLIFNHILPIRLGFRNYAMKKDYLRQLVWDGIKLCGMERTAVMANEIKRLGFNHATRAGISFSTLTDVEVPTQKKAILEGADAKVAELREEWRAGMITREELYEQSLEIWRVATDQIAQHVQSVLDPYGSITTIANSGATKAKLQQIRQLSGMRGLMASPSGAIIETPVRGNFLEGLSVAEYFLSSHGARKSLMDRSLNTAQSGYLTIQLVNAAQEVIVTEEDCGTRKSLLISLKDSQAMGLADNSSRLLGRVLAEDLPEADLKRGEELGEVAIARILDAGIEQVHVYSVLTCQTRHGVCCKCYGWDLSRRALVASGIAVGIIAAQSIGEPGTQLTMRTFHSGGIAGGQGDITQGIPRVKELFEARVPKAQALVSEIAGTVTVTTDEQSGGHLVQVSSPDQGNAAYELPPGRKPIVSSGQTIRAYDPLTTGDRNPHDILRHQGREALEMYLLQESQRVYRTTGAYIHDKHFEIIIRQMLRYVQIEQAGDTSLLPDDLVDHFVYEDTNAQITAQGGDPAIAHIVLLGLIRSTLATESWLAAASFQQTGRILTDSALEGRVDYLRGLKENVIIGKMIPAGTGLLPRPEPVRKKPGRRGRPPKNVAARME